MANDATVDITTASRTLGLSVEALRKRLQRGAARGYKAADGTWRVYLDGDGKPAPSTPDNAGTAGLSAEIATLKEDVRFLKSHLGDLRRALEEAVTGSAAGPALPSLASARPDDTPTPEQPFIAAANSHSDTTFPEFPADGFPADEAPWGDDPFDDTGPPSTTADGADDAYWPDGSAASPLSGSDGAHPFTYPSADPPLDEEAIRAIINETVDARLKPILKILHEALLAMSKSR